MEGQSQPFIVSFLKKNILFVSLFSASIVLIVFGLFQYLSPQKEEDIEFVPAEASVNRDAVSGSKIVVDVSGQVIKPGVYELKSDARIQDALSAAGGLSADADREYVARSVNLAQSIQDGMKLYIPSVGEQVMGVVSSNSTGVTSNNSASTTTSSGLVNINSASSSQLEALPKIGAVTAQKIIDGRPYTTIDELVEKKILGQKTFEAIKGSISTF